jgi:hypothetical protein
MNTGPPPTTGNLNSPFSEHSIFRPGIPRVWRYESGIDSFFARLERPYSNDWRDRAIDGVEAGASIPDEETPLPIKVVECAMDARDTRNARGKDSF